MGADLIFSKMSLNCIQEMILLHHSTALIKKRSKIKIITKPSPSQQSSRARRCGLIICL